MENLVFYAVIFLKLINKSRRLALDQENVLFDVDSLMYEHDDAIL